MLILHVTIFLVFIAFLVMYIIGIAWVDVFFFPLPAWLSWTGFGLGVISLLFWIWTQVALDSHWSAQVQLRKEHKLVISDPYARIRHLFYAAIFAWAIALVLLTANWLFGALAVLSIAWTVGRVPKEEKMMLEAFGDENKAYIQRTGRYLPKL